MAKRQLSIVVDIIIPVHNGQDFIAEALNSILNQENCINQESIAFRIIVVDDASTDGTVKVVSDFKSAELIRSHRVGQGEALNIGIRATCGDFIAFLDADDLWMPGKLNAQVGYLIKNPGIDGVYGLTAQFENSKIGTLSVTKIPIDSPPQSGLVLGSLLIRRAALQRIGGFSSDLQVNPMLDWHSRAIRSELKFDLLEEVVLRRRIHKRNLTLIHRSSVVNGYFNAIKRHLETNREVTSKKK
jgi:glycosyltransferase involved in cell wall biosynthesis